ncbi:MAG: hypothetical protein ACREQM_03940 [Candidatus Dormibacteraceae bacterium]
MPQGGRRSSGEGVLRRRAVPPWAGEWPDLAPVTIVRLGRWVAFPLGVAELPAGHAEPGFLGAYDGPYGRGDTPDAAYLDLARRLRDQTHPSRRPR